MSYRSAIFYTSDEQRRTAEEPIADVDASGLWPEHVVTEVAPAGDFWEAEPGHQDKFEGIPHGFTCNLFRHTWNRPRQSAPEGGSTGRKRGALELGPSGKERK